MKRIFITAVMLIFCLMAFGFIYAEKQPENPSNRRVLVIGDNDCDATGFWWQIDEEAKAFLDFYGRDAYAQKFVQGGTKREMKKAVKSFFKNSDENDINVICLMGHGKETAVKCGTDILSDKDIAELLNDMKGKGNTAVFLDCCFGGKLAENTMKLVSNDRVGIISCCYDSETWTGDASIWWEEKTNLADRNKDGLLSLAEIFDYCKKSQYLYNRVMYIKARMSPDKASKPQLVGFMSTPVASVDKNSDISNLKLMKEDIHECNELLFGKKADPEE